ncbi:O-antigen ligase family protein [Lewinella sp. LCG006]|uniref:O-antigen ligase family protein n=1 Tax=Lewinella sp. LCG006 TaxID=3231911 RepID=UPI00346073BB
MSQSRSISVFLLGALLLTFLIKVPALIDEFHVSRFIVATLCCFWAILLVFPKLKSIKLNPMDGLLFGFYFLNLISISWADNFGEAIFTSQKYLLLAVIYLAFRLIFEEDKKYVDTLYPILIATAVIACLVPTIQMIGVASAQGLGGNALYNIAGHSGHKNLASSYLFLLFSLLLYWTKSLNKKPWLYLLLAWMVLLILLLRARAVYLAIGAFAVINIGYFLLADASLRQLALRRILPTIVVLAIAGGAIIALSGAGQQYLKYLNPATYSQSASAIERNFVWYKTRDLIKDRPVLGYGSGNWKLFFPSKSVEGAYRIQEKDLIFTRVHNDYLEVWAEVGIPGLLLFCGVFVFAFWQAWQGFRRAKPAFKTRWVLLGATLLGFCIISFFDFPKERIEHQVILALLLALIGYERVKGSNSRLVKLDAKQQRMLFSGSLILLLMINLPIGYYRFVGDAASKQIMTFRNTDKFGIIKTNAIKGSSFWYNVDPMVIPLSWYQGVAEYSMGNYEAARTSFEDAYEINPYNFNVINNLASTLVQLQAYENAIPLYLKALTINPKFEEGMFNLSFAYYQTGALEEALALVNKTESNPEKKEVFRKQIQDALDARD